MRYFFHIGYAGTRYNGWQRLPQIVSIQETIEKVLSRIVKSQVSINGCGRTDTKVHASQYFFHVDLDEQNLPELVYRMNKNLPHDIAVFEIIPMDSSAHARLHATQREYNYFIHRYKDPFLNSFSSLYEEGNLDIEKMKTATALLTRYHDYRAFYKTASKPRTTICRVTNASLSVDESGDRIKFTISANRFLHGMVRVIVQKLLEVGRDNLTVEQFENYLALIDIPKDIKPAYPQGLYLSKVTYPFLDIPPMAKFASRVNGENEWKLV